MDELISIKDVQARFMEINSRLISIEAKLNALWDYNLRRARTETLYKGFGTEHSPLVITDEVKKIYEKYLPELKAFFKKVNGGLTDRELFILIDAEFGERFVREICVPYGMASGACIDIACALCKESGDD